MRYSKEVSHKPITRRVREPKIGSFREVVRFAILPIKINNTERVFWENYTKVYRYQKVEITHYNPETCEGANGIDYVEDEDGRMWFNRWVLYKRKHYEIQKENKIQGVC